MIDGIRSASANAVIPTAQARRSVTNTTATQKSFASTMDSYAAESTTSVYSTYNAKGGYVSGVGRGSAYTPPSTVYANVRAKERELEELCRDFAKKRDTGFFENMDHNERFAHVFETFSDAFGSNFIDYYWQHMSEVHPASNAEEAAQATLKSKIDTEFYIQLRELGVSGDIRAEAFSNYFGYGGMTAEEKYNAIISEYALKGGGSYAATFKMLWLLGETGATDRKMINDAMSILSDKLSFKYAGIDMSVTDMMKSRYANAFYAYDADAAILDVVGFIQERNRNMYRAEPNSKDIYNRQDVQDFFKKLEADLGALGKDIGGAI